MITDATLCYMEKASKQQQYSILNALAELPVDAVELTVPVFENIAGMRLPPKKKYILRINSRRDIGRCKSFYRYVRQAPSAAETEPASLMQYPLFTASGRSAKYRAVGAAYSSVFDMKDVFAEWSAGEKITSFEPLNSSEQAVSLAFAWFCRGGEIVTTFCGIANHAPLEEVLLALHLSGIRKLHRKLDFTVLKKLVAAAAGMDIPITKPVVGEAIFAVESGIHVDGIMKNPQLYEPYPPELVGARRRIVLGSTSGRRSIEAKLIELKLSCTRIDKAAVLEMVKQKSRALCRAITDKEFCDLVETMGRA